MKITKLRNDLINNFPLVYNKTTEYKNYVTIEFAILYSDTIKKLNELLGPGHYYTIDIYGQWLRVVITISPKYDIR